MKQTHYLTVTVQEGNRFEISMPILPVGQRIEVILIVPEDESSSLNPFDHHAFLRLPLEERRRIMTEQAEAMVEYYQQDTEWKEWVNLDIGEIHGDQPQTR